MFIVFNVISWQCIAGPALVLFARHIDMPASWVGFLVSFMPMSMLLIVCTTGAITRLGSKRVMMASWLARNIVSCSVFAMPLAVSYYGPRAAWYTLMGATLGFCVLRAVGAGGWLPWLHEVVPQHQRGTYFSMEAAVSQSLNILVMLGQGLALQGNPGTGRYLGIYGAGVAVGLASLLWMSRIPGGKGQSGPARELGAIATYRKAIGDTPYARFVVLASLSFGVLSLFTTAALLYMRDALLMPSNGIMYLTAAGSAAVLLTVRFWGRTSDRRGSSPVCAATMAGHSAFCALALLALPQFGAFSRGLIMAVVVANAIFCAAFGIAANRAMLNRVNVAYRVGYANFWTVSTAIAMAIAPIVAGFLIDHGGAWGYRACFLLAMALGLLCAWRLPAVIGDAKTLGTVPIAPAACSPAPAASAAATASPCAYPETEE